MCIKAFTDLESRSVDGLPVAKFSTNVTNGYVPLTVQFTDRSTNATGREWNFGDGATSTGLNPTHTYRAAGIYTVNLTVSNAVGTNSMLATINILIKISQKNSYNYLEKTCLHILCTPLSNVQLNSTTSVHGAFVYTHP